MYIIYTYIYIPACVFACVKLKYEISLQGLLHFVFCQNCISSANLVAEIQEKL